MERVAREPRLELLNPQAVRRARSAYQRRLVWVVGAVLAASGLAAFIAIKLGRNGALGAPAPHWAGATVVGPVLLVVGFVVEAVALTYAVRSGRVRKARRSPLWALMPSQRRALFRQVVRNRVTPGADPVALRLVATELLDQLWLIWIHVGTTMILTGQGMMGRFRVQVMLAAAGMVLSGLAVLAVIRRATRADAFLRAHPAPPVRRTWLRIDY